MTNSVKKRFIKEALTNLSFKDQILLSLGMYDETIQKKLTQYLEQLIQDGILLDEETRILHENIIEDL